MQILRVAFASILVLLTSCQAITSRLLLYPTTEPIAIDAPSTARTERRFVPIGEVDGSQLELILAEVGPPGPVEFSVLTLPGKGGPLSCAEKLVGRTARLVAQAFDDRAQPRFRIIAVQYPGFGASTGPLGLERRVVAAERGLAELRSMDPDSPVLVHGFSMGTTAALSLMRRVNGEDRPCALILEKPPDVWGQLVWQHGWWNLWMLSLPLAWGVPETCRSDLNAAEVVAPALFVIGRDDGVVPASYAKAIAVSSITMSTLMYRLACSRSGAGPGH